MTYDNIRDISPARIQEELAEHSHSVRAAARAMNVSRGALRRYLVRNNPSGVVRPPPAHDEQTIEIRDLRKLEKENAKLAASLRLEKQKRKNADAELALTNETIAVTSESRGAIKTYKVSNRKPGKSNSEATAVVLCSDWHLEKGISADEVNGLNSFDLEIAALRIDRLWRKSLYMLDFARGISKIDELVVWLGGDLIQGHLRDEDLEHNLLGPTEAILYAQRHIASGLKFLRDNAGVRRIRVVVSLGNHSRVTKQMQASGNEKHNWEYVLAGNLAMHFADDPMFEFILPKGYFSILDISGHLVRFSHGDAIKYGGGIGGVSIPLRKKIASWNRSRPVTCDVIGHFHNHESQWEYVINGALCGYDSYAMRIGAAYQPPTQTFCVFDRDYGRVLTTPIFLEKPADGKVVAA